MGKSVQLPICEDNRCRGVLRAVAAELGALRLRFPRLKYYRHQTRSYPKWMTSMTIRQMEASRLDKTLFGGRGLASLM